MGYYGDNQATSVHQSPGTIVTGSWRALNADVNGDGTPLKGRRSIKIFVRGNAGHAIGLAYSNVAVNTDGVRSFPTPSDDIRNVTIYPGQSTFVEPVSGEVQIFGQLLGKVGVSDSSIKVIVTEYK